MTGVGAGAGRGARRTRRGRLARERYVQGGALPDGHSGVLERAVAGGGGALERAPVRGMVLRTAMRPDRQMSYHAAAQLLQQPGALRVAEAGRRAPRSDRLHRRCQQERHAR